MKRTNEKMVRVVGLGKTGIFIVLRDGDLAELAGRTFWSTPADVWAAIEAENVPACDEVLQT